MADLLQKQMDMEQRELDALYLEVGKRCCELTGIAGMDKQLDDSIQAVSVLRQSIAANKRCKGCMALLKEGAQFCPKCGLRVEKEVICAACGAVMKEGAKFCAKCGSQVNSAPAVPVVPLINVCRSCGSTLKEGAAFCGHCGAKQ